jgi:hypothetical protein
MQSCFLGRLYRFRTTTQDITRASLIRIYKYATLSLVRWHESLNFIPVFNHESDGSLRTTATTVYGLDKQDPFKQ